MISKKTNILIVLSGIIAVVLLLGPFFEYYLFTTQGLDSTVKTSKEPATTKPVQVEVSSQKIEGIQEWVPGKSLRECMNGQNEMNEEVLRCHNGYYRDWGSASNAR